jgi:methyl-accepting chemotaxis protein/NAD-dependent dihydropyrimidine dehydrogenase PreA subunit
MRDVVYTVDANCVGCNKCIRNCPVMGANISYVINGENKVRVDQDRCIRCGACIASCSHDARRFNDDTERFFNDLRHGKKISVVVAPAARINFENHGKLIGFLKASGVNLVYDVSFGADITTWAYLKAIREKKLSSLISQPCPAVVNYIEKYRPELIPQLAPVHSPTLCTAIYMKQYMKVADDIAFLSPCIGKVDEFSDPETGGHVSYNVTYAKLQEYISSAGIDLSRYEDTPYDDIGCWLGCLYSRPGGLRENVEALVDGAWVRQIEGSHHVYGYLDAYRDRIAAKKPVPLLVDALNCANGCNIGTATCKRVSVDDADNAFNSLKNAKKNEKSGLFRKRSESLFAMFNAKLKLADFMRGYADRRIGLKDPSESELEAIYRDMHKDTDASRRVDCSACGYQTCSDMARAIFNGINTKGNCIAFNRQEIAYETRSVGEKTRIIDELSVYTDRVLSVLDEVSNLNLDVSVDGEFSGEFSKIKDAINGILETLDATLTEIKVAADQFGVGAEQVSQGSTNLASGAGEQAAAVQKLSSLIVMLTEKTKLNANNANRARDLSSSAKNSAEDGNRLMQDMQKSMEEIKEASSNITKILKTIDDIAFQTNILALNAAVESARAGKYGKGFAVVADEVRNLAAKCSDAAKESAAFIDESIAKVKNGTGIANTTASALEKIVRQSNEIAVIVEEIAKTSSEQSGGIDDINANIRQVAHVVQVNSETSQTSAATSEELSAQAISLKESVSRFRLRQKSVRESVF